MSRCRKITYGTCVRGWGNMTTIAITCNHTVNPLDTFTQLLLFRNFSVLYSREPWSPRYRFHRLYVGSLSAKPNLTIYLRSGPKVVRRSAGGHRFGGPFGCQLGISFAWTLKGAPTCRLARIGLPPHDVRWARTMVQCPRPCGVARRPPPRAEGLRGGGHAWSWWGWV